MNLDIQIDTIKRSDIEELRNLFSKAGHYVSPRSLSDYWLYAYLFNNTCLAAKLNEKLVGSIIAFCDQTKNYKEIYIQDVALLPDYQGQGIGSMLMEEFIKVAKKLNIERVWLTSEPDNEKAYKLWTKFGFENKEADYQENGLWVTKDLKGAGKDRVIYSLEL
jgi:ribosomal protein S18 acetylase RimI-like enzyme